MAFVLSSVAHGLRLVLRSFSVGGSLGESRRRSSLLFKTLPTNLSAEVPKDEGGAQSTKHSRCYKAQSTKHQAQHRRCPHRSLITDLPSAMRLAAAPVVSKFANAHSAFAALHSRFTLKGRVGAARPQRPTATAHPDHRSLLTKRQSTKHQAQKIIFPSRLCVFAVQPSSPDFPSRLLSQSLVYQRDIEPRHRTPLRPPPRRHPGGGRRAT